MQWVVPVWLLVVVGQRIGPVSSRALFGRVGFWMFWLGSVLASALVLVTRRFSLLDWLLGLLALLPAIVTWVYVTRDRKRPKSSLMLALFSVGIGLVFASIAASSPLGLLNGYPMPVAGAGIAMAGLSLLSLLVPHEILDAERIAATAAAPFLLIAAPMLVVAFSFYVSMRADHFFPGNACMEDSHGARFDRAYWISPRRMLFDNEYKGLTIPYLLLGPDGGTAERHWSFREMDFVANESRAFSMPIPRWNKASGADVRCVLSRAG